MTNRNLSCVSWIYSVVLITIRILCTNLCSFKKQIVTAHGLMCSVQGQHRIGKIYVQEWRYVTLSENRVSRTSGWSNPSLKWAWSSTVADWDKETLLCRLVFAAFSALLQSPKSTIDKIYTENIIIIHINQNTHTHIHVGTCVDQRLWYTV